MESRWGVFGKSLNPMPAMTAVRDPNGSPRSESREAPMRHHVGETALPAEAMVGVRQVIGQSDFFSGWRFALIHCSRKTNFWIFPVGVSGNESTNWMEAGTLYEASWVRQ